MPRTVRPVRLGRPTLRSPDRVPRRGSQRHGPCGPGVPDPAPARLPQLSDHRQTNPVDRAPRRAAYPPRSSSTGRARSSTFTSASTNRSQRSSATSPHAETSDRVELSSLPDRYRLRTRWGLNRDVAGDRPTLDGIPDDLRPGPALPSVTWTRSGRTLGMLGAVVARR
jgi:hypothetical protein